MSTRKNLYGQDWAADADPLEIELFAIANGGKWQNAAGKECGAGLISHMMSARKLLWPNRYRHRWTDLLYEQFIANDITIMMGAASTQKTSHASEFALINYFARPHKTLVVLSTVTADKLDTGVFGEVKMLWEQASRLHPWVPGCLLEARRAIATDSVLDGDVRDLRRGIVGRACYTGGKWVGLGILAGTKQEYVIYLCDEVQFMAETFIASWPNLFSNGHVKIIGSGNPKHDPDDQLGIAAEPRDGWPSVGIPRKTTVWETKFLNGKCVNLVGVDSPNFDVPEGQPEPYPKLIGRRFANRIAHDWGVDSAEYSTQVLGVMRIDMADARVITRQLCKEHGASEPAQWANTKKTKIYALDPAYGGGDRCVGIPGEFGESIDGTEILSVGEPEICQVNVNIEKKPEDQIADWLADRLEYWETPVENSFYDSFGRGTLGYAFARKFKGNQPIPVDSGGHTTNRPVREGLMIDDRKTGLPRPKLCSEHYSKFVTEMWFSTRYCIEANQIRNLQASIIREGCARRYYTVAGNKIEVEPKTDPKRKEDLKRRLGKSPDEYDTFAILTEGARQRGFTIKMLGNSTSEDDSEEAWFEAEAKKYADTIRSKLLVHR